MHKVADLQGALRDGEALLRDSAGYAYVRENGGSIRDVPCGFLGHKHQCKITPDGWFYCPNEEPKA